MADFGVARVQTPSGVMTAETGTYRWMAPEVGFLKILLDFDHFIYLTSCDQVTFLRSETLVISYPCC